MGTLEKISMTKTSLIEVLSGLTLRALAKIFPVNNRKKTQHVERGRRVNRDKYLINVNKSLPLYIGQQSLRIRYQLFSPSEWPYRNRMTVMILNLLKLFFKMLTLTHPFHVQPTQNESSTSFILEQQFLSPGKHPEISATPY